MLSILIPVYNFDVRRLVADLHGQCLEAGIEFEILCFDDGSAVEYKRKNVELRNLPKVTYREMPRNLGRSAIRNELGRAAKFDYLLFMDCDSKVLDSAFVQKYIEGVFPAGLVYGGRVYASQMPDNQSYLFHWKYGSEREVQPPVKRKAQPWSSFMTNNFLVPKHIFLDIQFDETLKQYGHEDTLFGLELAARKIHVKHIDAPLEHIGLETAEVFLKKTKQGLENLHQLYEEGKPIDTKLLAFFKKLGGSSIFLGAVFFRLFEKLMVWQLQSKSPSMLVFDVYKITCLCNIARQ